MKVTGTITKYSTGKVLLLLVISLFISFQINGQAFYSVNPDYLKTKSEASNLLSDYYSNYPDSSVSGFHEFFPRNFMGNTGMPSPDYYLRYGTSDLGFRFYKLPYNYDRFTEKGVAYYRTKGPFADLTGIAGSKQLQIFKMLFTHTFKDKINFTLKFNRYTSQGFYLRQQTFTNNLQVSSNYTNAKKQWGYYFYFLNNSNKHQENGGISADTLSDSLLTISKDLLPVKLTAATRDNREYRLMFNPWYRLNKVSDSSTVFEHFIDVKSRANIEIYKYKDGGLAKDNYYTLFYLDTANTNDSSRVAQLINEVNYSLQKTDHGFGFSLGYKNEINQVWQKADSTFINNILRGDIKLTIDKTKRDSAGVITGNKLVSTLNFQYVFSGPNSGNIKIENNTTFNIHGRHVNRFYLDAMFEERNPDYIYNYWVSNNFTWFNNGYLPQQTISAKVGYNFDKLFKLGLIYSGINNYLYFDNVAQPRQYPGTIQNIGLQGQIQYVFFKHLGVYVEDVLQNTSHPSYVSIPPNILTARLFYSGSYQDKMQINYGLQLQYYSSFYGYNYMPASQAFYLQDKYKTGQYPFLDVYLNARIRPVTVFLKIENVLQGFAGTQYSFVPGYYQTDRAFRFGISWLFFD